MPGPSKLRAFRLLSRRDVLLAPLALRLLACRSGESPPTDGGKAPPSSAAGGPWAATSGSNGPLADAEREAPALAPLDAVTVGTRTGQGGVLAVLLHGWGAPGDDLVPLARALAHPDARFVVPAAPLERARGGRAWWHLDGGDRPKQAWSDELPAGHRPHPAVSAARTAVQRLLRGAIEQYAPERTVLAGFSQGAMLALDVALHGDPAVHGVAVLSGALLADSLAALRSARRPRPSVLVAHGRQDPVVPFAAGESIPRMLSAHGIDVTWVPFEGGHGIPPLVVERLKRFLVQS
ncbi:MAG: dienelactone hydrolase family protein [Pseudomonadota bacterium]|nr:MAG: hypothetical protein DIU78_16630 [Pseudomonadota bacterium]